MHAHIRVSHNTPFSGDPTCTLAVLLLGTIAAAVLVAESSLGNQGHHTFCEQRRCRLSGTMSPLQITPCTYTTTNCPFDVACCAFVVTGE